jgi:hypothetical protein
MIYIVIILLVAYLIIPLIEVVLIERIQYFAKVIVYVLATLYVILGLYLGQVRY